LNEDKRVKEIDMFHKHKAAIFFIALSILSVISSCSSDSEKDFEDKLSSNTYYQFDPVIESLNFEGNTVIINRYSVTEDGKLVVKDGSIVPYSTVDGIIYLESPPFLDSSSRILNVSEDFNRLQRGDTTYDALSPISSFYNERYFASAETDLPYIPDGTEEFYYVLKSGESSSLELESNFIDYENQVFIRDTSARECDSTPFFNSCEIDEDWFLLSSVTERNGYVTLHNIAVISGAEFEFDPDDVYYYKIEFSNALEGIPSKDGLLEVEPKILTITEWAALVTEKEKEAARLAEEEAARIAEEARIAKEEALRRKIIEENLNTCLDGRYSPLCDYELLTPEQLAQARAAEARIATEKARIEEESRIATEKARIEEESRIAAEEARIEEESRIAAEEAANVEEVFKEDYLPLVAIAPTYPGRAARRGITGWCIVSFTVNAAGNVEEDTIKVVDAEPADIFDRSSISAAAKFKFQPRVVDGQAVPVSDVEYTFRYEFE
jgi:TonB family protein